MSLTTSYRSLRSGSEHFEPSEINDQKAQRQLHAKLEQIDYTAYAANRKEITESLGEVDTGKFERLAAAAARARCQWIAEALVVSSETNQPSVEQIGKLSELRTMYDELTQAYEALRRLVERSYLAS
jgi:hypothetical protein